MPDSNDQKKAGQNQVQPVEPIPAPQAAAGAISPVERKARAIEEAAHAIVAHELGATVNWINIDNHPNPALKLKTKTDTTWPVNPANFYHTDKLDQQAIHHDRVWAMRMVACFVAGEVARFAGADAKLISHPDRIPAHFWEATPQPKEKSDRGMVAWVLSCVGIYERGEIANQEQRARDILRQRNARHDYLVEKLLKNGYVDGDDLRKGLNL